MNFRTCFAPASHLLRSKEGCLSYRSCDTDEEYDFGFEKGKTARRLCRLFTGVGWPGCWRGLARRVHNPEAVGSNPVLATKTSALFGGLFCCASAGQNGKSSDLLFVVDINCSCCCLCCCISAGNTVRSGFSGRTIGRRPGYARSCSRNFHAGLTSMCALPSMISPSSSFVTISNRRIDSSIRASFTKLPISLGLALSESE